MQTMQQQRARYALEKIQYALENIQEKKGSSEFLSYASAMPAMILMNGLGQTAAFYRSKGKDSTHERLYILLSEWLSRPEQPYSGQDLLAGITSCDMRCYLLAQAEALALLDWVKKFAKAYMKE